MPITYYADRVQKRAASPIELLQKDRKILSVEGGANLDDGDMNAVIWPGLPAWTLKQISLYFSESDPKTYSISKLVGRGIISGLNDKIWLKADGAPAQEIILSPGFYDNDSNKLVDELKTQLDSNAAFVELGMDPFTVTFTESTGLFEITPNAGTFQFLSRNNRKPAFHWDSTAGSVFGLTEDSTMGSSIISDSTSMAFGNTFEIVSDSASAATNISLTDSICMSVDDALLVSASGDMIASYLASYKED